MRSVLEGGQAIAQGRAKLAAAPAELFDGEQPALAACSRCLQLMPEPQPISASSISQGMPGVQDEREAGQRRPIRDQTAATLRLGRPGGNGTMAAQRSSGTNGLAMPSAMHQPLSCWMLKKAAGRERGGARAVAMETGRQVRTLLQSISRSK